MPWALGPDRRAWLQTQASGFAARTPGGVAFSIKSWWFWLGSETKRCWVWLSSQTQNTSKRCNSVGCSWPDRSKTLQKGVGSGCPARPIDLGSGCATIPKDIRPGSAAKPKDNEFGMFCSFLWFKFIFHTIKRKQIDGTSFIFYKNWVVISFFFFFWSWVEFFYKSMFVFVFQKCFEKNLTIFYFFLYFKLIFFSLIHIKMFLYYFNVII